jgi:peptidoglycan/xylan/chitin deacetylase (PgdA/CDA1 family)
MCRLVTLLATAAVVLAFGAGSMPAEAAGQTAPAQSLLDACFTPADLAMRPGEKIPRKGQRAFDRAEEPRTLRAFDPVPAPLRGAIRRVKLPPGENLVALTFDLCEQPGEIAGYDGALIDYLRQEGVKATFFIGGKWLRSHEPRARQLMADPLFEVANHAAAHRNLRLLSGKRLTEEIEGPQLAYEAIHDDFAKAQCVRAAPEAWRAVPERMPLFRFPFGACNKASLDAVNDAGLLAIQWDVSTGDPAPTQSAQAIARQILRSTRPGSIVIGHANGRGFNTAAALPLAIPKLKAQGYRFVTVSELLAAGTPEIVSACYNLKPGDTDRYDNLATAFRRNLPKATAAKRAGSRGGGGWAATVKTR